MLGTFAAWWLGIVVAGGLAPVDPRVIPDDLISLNCVPSKGCWALDGAGNLWFDANGVADLRLRGRFPHHALVKIRFSGLLEGWALDRRGGLFRTRDGGRTWLSQGLQAGLRLRDIALGPDRTPRLLAADGGVWRPGKADSLEPLFPGEGKPALALAAAADGALAALGEQGEIRAWAAGTAEPRRSMPLEGQAASLMFGRDRALWATACRGEVRVSRDLGTSFQAAPELPGPWRTICPRLAGALADGRVLLVGLPGEALVGPDPAAGWQHTQGGPQRGWREAAAWADGLLLVGDGGGRARFPGKAGPLALEPLAPAPGTVLALACLEGTKAYRLEAGGALLASRDTGQTWEARPPAPAGLTAIAFLDEKHGLGLETHTLHATADGGATWTALGSWPALSLAAVAARTAKRILVLGKGGAVLRSEDGGKSWTQDRVPTQHTLAALAWPDDRAVFAVGEKRQAFRSQDGGRTWTELGKGRGNLTALSFLDGKQGWLVGAEGLTLATKDGGASFATSQAKTTEALHDVVFVDRLRGLAAAGRGGLFRTSDGGESWQPWPLPTRAAVTRVACWKKPRRCLVGGEQGLLLVGDPFRGPPPEPLH